MRSALKDTTQRYKSLAGFAIYACRVRYIFDAICPLGREGIYIISQPTAREVISHLSVSENISRLR